MKGDKDRTLPLESPSDLSIELVKNLAHPLRDTGESPFPINLGGPEKQNFWQHDQKVTHGTVLDAMSRHTRCT